MRSAAARCRRKRLRAMKARAAAWMHVAAASWRSRRASLRARKPRAPACAETQGVRAEAMSTVCMGPTYCTAVALNHSCKKGMANMGASVS